MANFTPAGVELSVKGLSSFISDMAKGDKAIGKFGDSGTESQSKLSKFSGSIAGVATVAGGALVAGVGAAAFAIGGLAAVGASAAISYESAFAGVIKTTDGLVDEMGELTQVGKELKDGFVTLSREIPITPEVLANIGELGGQLGIGQDSLLEFTETIAALGVATNLTVEEAATQFAQLGNIMGTNQDDFDNLGSSLVALGNNFATTEADIINFASRIAGAGTISGLTEGEVLGISTAFSSIGISAEAGGTAVQKALLGMNTAVATGNESLAIFASTAGLNAIEFSELWETDASQAFELFVTGLGQQGDNAITTLDELGLKDQQLVRAFLSLSNSGNLLTNSIALGNQAFAENTALTNEAAQRYATTESKIIILKNSLNAVARSVGDALLPAFNTMLDTLTGFVSENESFLIPFFESLSDWLTENIPKAIEALASFWENNLQPIFVITSEFIKSTVIPNIVSLANILSRTLAQGTRMASSIWESDLLPVFSAVSDFIMNQVLPAVTLVAGFLIEQMPLVSSIVSQSFNLIKGAISVVSSFIVTNVIPTLESLGDWFQENMPLIQAATKTAWTVIQSIIDTVSSIISTQIIPNLQSAFNDITQTLNDLGIDWSDVWEVIKTILTIAAAVMGVAIVGFIGVVTSLISSISAAVSNITSAISSLVSGFQTQFQLAEDLFMALSEVVTNILEGDFIGAFNSVGEATGILVEIFANSWEIVKSSFDLFFGTIIEGTVAFIGSFLGFFEGMANRMGGTLIPGFVDDIISIMDLGFSDVLQIITQFISDTISAMVMFITNMVTVTIPNFIEDMAGKFTEGFPIVLATFTSFINDAVNAIAIFVVDTVTVTIPNFIGDMATKFTEGFPVVLATFTNFINDVINAIATFVTDTITVTIPNFIGDMATEFTEGFPIVLASFTSFINDAVNILSSGFPLAIDEINLFIAESVEEFNNFVSSITNVLSSVDWRSEAKDIVQSLINGISDKGQDLVQSFGVIVQNITGVFAQLDWSAIGKSIAEGIAKGINDSASAIADALTDAASNGLSSIKDLLGISSPSTAFMKIGEEIVNGLIIGIRSGEENVTESIFSLLGNVSSLVGGLASQFQSRVVNPLEEESNALTESLEATFQQLDQAGELSGIIDIETGLSVSELGFDAFNEFLNLLALAPTEGFDPLLGVFDLSNFNAGSEAFALINEAIQSSQALLGVNQELTEEQQRLLEIEQQRADVQFLQQQLDLLELAGQAGAGDLLSGFEFGLDADIGELLDLTAAVFGELINQAEGELGISSPSERFFEMGQNVMLGFINGIDSLFSLPQQIMNDAISPQPLQSSVINNTSRININQTFNNQMDMMAGEALLNNALGRAVL